MAVWPTVVLDICFYKTGRTTKCFDQTQLVWSLYMHEGHQFQESGFKTMPLLRDRQMTSLFYRLYPKDASIPDHTVTPAARWAKKIAHGGTIPDDDAKDAEADVLSWFCFG